MPTFNKTISAAVGRGGSNLSNDVVTVKYLLNTVDPDVGGPDVLLTSATTLPELTTHIEVFQRKQSGRADGRVDSEGTTLKKLRQFDPTPGDPAFLPSNVSGKKRAGFKKGGTPLPPGPKQIQGSVGREGDNNSEDIIVVKHLLNNVPERSGGPVTVILVRTPIDELIKHIEVFQRRQGGLADGRVDPQGTTMRRLRTFDPTPPGPSFVPSSASGFKRA